MEPFKIKDGFGSELVLFSVRYNPGYGITALYLVNQGIYTEKEPRVLSPDVKFVVNVIVTGTIHHLFYKTHESALKALDALTKAANKEDG